MEFWNFTTNPVLSLVASFIGSVVAGALVVWFQQDIHGIRSWFSSRRQERLARKRKQEEDTVARILASSTVRSSLIVAAIWNATMCVIAAIGFTITVALAMLMMLFHMTTRVDMRTIDILLYLHDGTIARSELHPGWIFFAVSAILGFIFSWLYFWHLNRAQSVLYLFACADRKASRQPEPPS